MKNIRLQAGWDIEPLTPNNLEHCLIRAGIARAVLDACSRWNKELPSGGRLLDIGCGSQPYRPWIEAAGLTYHSIDWPNSIHDSPPNDVTIWDLTQTPWPFSNAEFDAILCTEVLEHLPDPDMFLRECARVCRANALLVLTTPLAWPEHEVPYDYYRFTQHGLRYLLEKAAFSVEEIVPRGGWHTAIAQLIGFWGGLAFNKPWNYITRLLTWPIVALLAWFETDAETHSELLFTLGFTIFARRRPPS